MTGPGSIGLHGESQLFFLLSGKLTPKQFESTSIAVFCINSPFRRSLDRTVLHTVAYMLERHNVPLAVHVQLQVVSAMVVHLHRALLAFFRLRIGKYDKYFNPIDMFRSYAMKKERFFMDFPL